MASRAVTQARRQAAVDRAVEVGVEQAAAEAEITVATLHRWAVARGVELPPEPEPVQAVVSEPGPPSRDDEPPGPEPSDRLEAVVERMRRSADQARALAEKAIRRTDALLDAGRASEARNAAAAGGIWSDKAVRWEEAIAAAEERRARLAQAQAELVAALVRAFVEALGLELDPPARLVLRGLLEQSAAGEELRVSPAVAAEARRSVRERIGAELRDQIEAGLRERVQPEWQAEHRGLPAPAGDAEDAEPEPMVAPRRVVRAMPPRQGGAEEVVTGEVVEPLYDDEVPAQYLAAYRDERRARAGWEAYKRSQAEAARREGEREHVPPSRWRGLF